MEPISLSALLLSAISIIAIFVKTIRKCKCNSTGLEIERRDETGREEQYHFILELVKSLKSNFTPRKKDLSDKSTKSTKSTKSSDKDSPIMTQQVVNDFDTLQPVLPMLKIVDKTTTHEIAEQLDMVPRDDKVTTIIPISELISQSKSQNHSRNSSGTPRLTPFIISRK
jgi:hypothetical protein